MKRDAGNATAPRKAFGHVREPEAGNAPNLIAGSGVQQTRNPSAEETAEVARNHEGGTGLDGWYRRAERSFGSGEWTR
jgi:hypothetical protein